MAPPSSQLNTQQSRSDLRASLRNRDPQGVADTLSLPPVAPGLGPSATDDEATITAFRDNVEKEYTKLKSILNREESSSPLSEQTGGNNGSATVEWGSLFKYWVLAYRSAELGDVDKCYQMQSNLHSTLNQIFSNSSGNWLLPLLHASCVTTHHLAALADERLGKGRNDHKRLQSAVTLLQESFSKALNDRTDYNPRAPLSEEGSKKAGVLFIVNNLFSMYFRLNTLRLCKNLLRPVESQKLHEQGTMGDRVTYRYYVGRLNMFEDQYEAAEQHLDFALLHCHKDSYRNKRRILNYLVPVKLMRGRLPTRLLLEKYSLDEYLPLVEGMRKGDMRTFQDGLNKYQELFIRRGTYLLLEKCKTICYRNLFKRIHVVSETTQISLDRVTKVFDWLGTSIDLDEVECILANLIYRGFLRGYISHTKRVLVLSKKEPFPSVAVVLGR